MHKAAGVLQVSPPLLPLMRTPEGGLPTRRQGATSRACKEPEFLCQSAGQEGGGRDLSRAGRGLVSAGRGGAWSQQGMVSAGRGMVSAGRGLSRVGAWSQQGVVSAWLGGARQGVVLSGQGGRGLNRTGRGRAWSQQGGAGPLVPSAAALADPEPGCWCVPAPYRVAPPLSSCS